MCFFKSIYPSADGSLNSHGLLQLAPECYWGQDLNSGCMVVETYDLFLRADQKLATSPIKPPATVMIATLKSSLSPGLILFSATAAAESSNPRSSNSIKSEKLLAPIVTTTANPT